MNNEDTLYMNVQPDEATQPQVNNTQPGVVHTGWKRVAFGGVSGILIGAAGAYAASQLKGDDTPADEQPSQTDEQPMAHNVTDDMTFAEAFQAARDEVGHSGIFTWHGNVYGTFTAEEWNAMNPNEQKAFYESINEHMPQPEPQHVAHAAAPQPQEVHVYHHVVNEQPPTTQADHYVPASNQPDTSDDDVRVVGEMYSYEGADGREVNVLPIETDGHKGVVMGHENPEVAIIDVDDSNSITEPDIVIDLTNGEAMTAGEMVAQAQDAEQVTDYMTTGYEQDTADPVPDIDPTMPDYMTDPAMDSGGMDPGIDMATDVDLISI